MREAAAVTHTPSPEVSDEVVLEHEPPLPPHRAPAHATGMAAEAVGDTVVAP